MDQNKMNCSRLVQNYEAGHHEFGKIEILSKGYYPKENTLNI